MSKSLPKYLMVLSGFILLAYVVIRAYLLSFTYDEATTFLFINDKAYTHLFSTANNHPLNSFFVWLFSSRFGKSEFILRLPNVIAFGCCVVYSVKLLNFIKNGWISLAGFVMIHFNPFMLDFFSVSRGYGLAIACMLMSIYYLIVSCMNATSINRSRSYSLFFASLAVLSNFVLLNYLLSLIVVFLFTDLYNRRNLKFIIRNNWGSAIICGILFLILFPMITRLIKGKQFYYGGKTGFVQDTIQSLLNASMYFEGYPEWVTLIILYVVFLFFGFGLILSFHQFLAHKKERLLSIIFIVLLFSIISPVAQFYILGTLLPLERTALFYLPLFALLSAFIVDYLNRTGIKWLSYLSLYFSILIGGAYILHFCRAANMHYTFNWKYDSDTKQAVEDLKIIYEENHHQLSIGMDWRLEPSTRYYRIKNGYNWLFPDPLNTPWYDLSSNKTLQEKPHDVFLFYKDDYPIVIDDQSVIKKIQFDASGLELIYVRR